MDYLYSKMKSLNRNVGAQVYTNGSFIKVFPVPNHTGPVIGQTLTDFADDIGIPDRLVCDLAPEQVGPHTDFMKEVQRLKIHLTTTEHERSAEQNSEAEVGIRELKKRFKHLMQEKKVPKRLWDYGLVHQAEILSIIARGKDKRPGLETILGQTIDISEWLDFDFYDRVWYWDHKKMDMTEEQAKLG
jgi:hypothetical protein